MFFRILGLLIAIGGLVILSVGALAACYYPVRRQLPSPLAMASAGSICFFVGVAVYFFASLLANAW
jgi:hypothetical protein